MYLNKEESQILWESIDLEKIKKSITKNIKEYNNNFETIINDINKENCDIKLTEIRRQILNRESTKINGTIIFIEKESESAVDVDSIFARGIDSFRAAIAISNCGIQNENHEQLFIILKNFHDNIKSYRHKKEIEAAYKEFKKFNGALASYLIIKKIVPNKESAKKSINFARDILWKESIGSEPSCTILQNKNENSYTIRYYKSLEIEEHQENSPWDNLDNQFWYLSLKNQLGSWFSKFMLEHKEKIKKLPSTSMLRSTPNPANSYDVSTISVENNKVKQVVGETIVAITQPFKIKHNKLLDSAGILDKKHAAITYWNHSLLMHQKRLNQIAQNYFERWDCKSSEITIPILHQTLISDDVPFSSDWKKANLAIDYKSYANDKIRRNLNKFDVYRKKDNTILFIEKTQAIKTKKNTKYSAINQNDLISENDIKIHFDILETNNCVNRHEKYSRVRPNDLNHARKLIDYAAQHLESTKSISENEKKIILNFLKSLNYSIFTPYKNYDSKIRNAAMKLAQTKNNDGLLIQAAIELKCTVHETYFGALRRSINEYLPSIPVLRWFGIMISFIVATIFKIITSVFLIKNWSLHHNTRRKSIYKSAYEGIIAQLLGALNSGCMSSLDRGTEVAALRRAMIQQYHDNGAIIGYNDPPKDKEKFIEDYGTIDDKKNFTKCASGAPTNSDYETRAFRGKSGLFSERIPTTVIDEEFNGLRKGQYYFAHDFKNGTS